MKGLTLGEYIRRLRREQKRSLHSISLDTKISYTHLSRIEADSTLPNADTVARLAEALGGDLKLMLEMAKCLPRAILDRIVTEQAAAQAGGLQRAAGQDPEIPMPQAECDPKVVEMAKRAGLEERAAQQAAGAFHLLTQLSPVQRSAVVALIASLYGEEHDRTG